MSPTTTQSAKLAFDDLVAPVGRDDFFATYWEKRHLFAHHHDPSYFGALFSFADFDRWMAAAQTNKAEVLVIVPPAGSGRPAERRTLREVSPTQLYGVFLAGHTLVLEGIETCWPAVEQLAARLSEAFSARVTVNLYMTPPDSQGVRIHSDVQDVLIFQVDGRKDWYLYEKQAEICLETLTHMRELRRTSRAPAESDAEPPLLELATLEKGDVLYIPRGLPHRAVAPAGSASLHLTACIEPISWVDFLKAAIEVASVSQPRLAAAVSPGFVGRPQCWPRLATDFGTMLRLFTESASFAGTLDVVTRSHLAASRTLGDGHFAQLMELDRLALEDPVERRAGLSCLVTRGEKNATLRFAGGEISGPPGLVTALELVRDRPCFRIAELPGLDDSSKLVLARRLIRDGLLRVARDSCPPAGWPSATA